MTLTLYRRLHWNHSLLTSVVLVAMALLWLEWQTVPVDCSDPPTESGWRLRSGTAQHLAGSKVRMLADGSDAELSVARTDTCTLFMVAAEWDGHFKHFLNTDRLQSFANRLSNVSRNTEVVLFLYTGESTGDGTIPLSLAHSLKVNEGTIGSYQMWACRGGATLGRVEIRNLNDTDENTVVQRVLDVCGSVHMIPNPESNRDREL